MAIDLRIGTFKSRLRFQFSHASATRTMTENVIVELRDDDRLTGFGEGCPRHYVTGETQTGAEAFIRSHGPEILERCTSIDKLRGWINENGSLIDSNPSAFSALELALLDLLSRRQGISVERLIGAGPLRGNPHYSAVIGDSSALKTGLASAAYALLGFADFKIKLSDDIEHDSKRLSRLPRNNPLRVDANNLWHDPEQCIRHIRSLGRKVWAIEEPVVAGDIGSMRVIAKQLSVKIILDESLLTCSQINPLLAEPDIWVPNIRVSKCGGVLRSIEIARIAQDAGMAVILGAHVGETSLLTRASLAVGQAMKRAPIAREGGYGTWLLRRDISAPPLRFSRRGILNINKYSLSDAVGWGLDVQPDRIHWRP